MDNNEYAQRSLFQLPYRSPDEIREIIRPLHPFLWPVVMEPWEDLVARRGSDKMFTDLTEEEMAIWLTMQAGKRAHAIFHGRQGVEVRPLYRKSVIIIPDALLIMVKKLTKRRWRKDQPQELMRSNYMTKRTKKVYNQECDAGLPDLPRVNLGYELLKEATEIRLVIAYPRTRGRGYEWVYRLPKPKVANPEFPKLRVYTGNDDTTERRGFVIGPSERQDEKKEGDNG